jgi:uncharacterized protein (TIGR00255 family)
MVKSMTAFARQELNEPWGQLTLELRSVNHRYLDIALRLPEDLRALEMKVRERVGRQLKRGKVDCNVRYQPAARERDEIELDMDLVNRLSSASREIDKVLYNPAPINSMDLLRWPGVLQGPSVDLEQIQERFMALLDEGLQALTAGRETEGGKLKQLILQRCDAVQAIVDKVVKLMPEIQQAYRDKLRQRLEEIQAEVDENRIEQELVILAQKMDVEEELDRLTAHVQEIRQVLEKDEPVGRRLDFLMQELHREANTLGSKSVDARTSTASVDLKVLIEQMREQVQNIE